MLLAVRYEQSPGGRINIWEPREVTYYHSILVHRNRCICMYHRGTEYRSEYGLLCGFKWLVGKGLADLSDSRDSRHGHRAVLSVR